MHTSSNKSPHSPLSSSLLSVSQTSSQPPLEICLWRCEVALRFCDCGLDIYGHTCSTRSSQVTFLPELDNSFCTVGRKLMHQFSFFTCSEIPIQTSKRIQILFLWFLSNSKLYSGHATISTFCCQSAVTWESALVEPLPFYLKFTGAISMMRVEMNISYIYG